MQCYLASTNCLMKCWKHKKIVKYVPLKKNIKYFIFPPKIYSSLKQQDQLLAYSKKKKKKEYLPAPFLRITQNLEKGMLVKTL